MLRGGIAHRFAHSSLGISSAVTGLLTVTWTAAVKAKPSPTSSPVVVAALEWAQANAWQWLFWLALATGLAQLLRSRLGPPWRWALIESMLGTFREHVFNHLEESEAHHHRVTLYKRVGWSWTCFPCWGGWLIPMARSSHTTRTGIATFRAPDDADKAQGIAGRTWAKNDAIVISGLPDLGTDKSDEAYRKYAEATSVDVKWLKKRLEKKGRPVARSYGGIPVLVKGKPWGVLVLDSRTENGVTKESYVKNRDYYKMLARFLGQILERTK